MPEMARAGSKLGKLPGRMCNGCPFKYGTPANREAHALQNAFDALMTQQTRFICHEQLLDDGKHQDCVGFLYAKLADQQL